MRAAIDAAVSAAAANAGVDVVYRRNGEAVSIRARVGKSGHRSRLESGAAIYARYRDYFVRAADLVLGDEPIAPQRGDVIEETIAGVVHQQEVTAEGDEPPARWSDVHQIEWRIHTQTIEAA